MDMYWSLDGREGRGIDLMDTVKNLAEADEIMVERRDGDDFLWVSVKKDPPRRRTR